ncbi:hypothetical protein [Ruoffia tabacinasalis]|uniref:Uncharacterized protein n=1 Tax=Ruoffia tabacinasalis TaxID=87458 RepID=A0ABS0LG91_9LACT|nr:hypothetical protein [Ruoffia tabacinasalis]MBG9977221.1 hypothetical protein [Ruoffia tabacinasalis]
MATNLNLPNAENQERIAKALEELAGKTFVTDSSGSPGATGIQKGDKKAGLYSFVLPQEFGLIEGNPEGQREMTASNLALACGLAAGTPINENTTWAKFSSMGEVIFVPVKPLRSSVSYIDIYEAGLVYGDGTNGRVVPTLSSGASAVTTKQETIVTIGGHRYSVRLMRGAGSDPLDSYNDADRGMPGELSEWNNLILPLHEKARLQDWAYPAHAGTTEDWGIGLSDEDLVTHSSAGQGSYAWCIEQSDVTPTARVIRGYNGDSYGNHNNAWYANSNYAWRPALVLLS